MNWKERNSLALCAGHTDFVMYFVLLCGKKMMK